MEKTSKKFEELLGTQIDLDKLGISREEINNNSNNKKNNKENSELEKEKEPEEETILNKFNKAYAMTGKRSFPVFAITSIT